MTKKTQAKNAMKPAEGSETKKEDKAHAAVDAENAKNGQEDGGKAGNDETREDFARDDNAGAGVKNDADADKTDEDKDPAADPETKPADPQDAAAQAAGDKTAEDEEIDLDDPEQVVKLFESVITGVIEFKHPVANSLRNKPKVCESWEKLVAKAEKLNAAHEAQKAKYGKKK